MESIEVRYTQVLGTDYYHKYIVYTDANGNQFAARGGSVGGGPSSGVSFLPGYIVTDYGPFDERFKDWDPENDDPRETITTGDDLSNKWKTIRDAIQSGNITGGNADDSLCVTSAFNRREPVRESFTQNPTVIFEGQV